MLRFRLVLLSWSLSAALFGVAAACDLPVCTNPRSQDLPRIAPDGSGGAIMVWRDNRNLATKPDLYAQHILAGLSIDPTWPVDGAPVTVAANAQDSPDIASDGAGGAFVVWNDFRNTSVTLGDVYIQHLTAGGAIAPGWPTDGLPISVLIGDQILPHVVADGSGGAIVVWEDHRSSTTGSDVYATRVLSNGTLAPGWAANGNPVCTATGDQTFPVVVADGSGGAVFAWDDQRSYATTGDDVYAMRLTGAGAPYPGWPIQGVALSAAPGPQAGNMTIAADASGGAYAAWQDYRSDPYGDIYAQHVAGSGAIASSWPQDGLLVCGATDQQLYPKVAADGTGGVFIVWDDYRDYNTTQADLFGLHLSDTGTIVPGWVANGLRLATGPGWQTTASLVLDGAGGLLFCYENYVSGPTLYAQHVNGDGSFAPGWVATGRAICNGPAADDQASAVSDDAGGMIIGMSHQPPATSGDIYASWVRRDLPVATLVSLVSDEAQPDQVTLSWYGAQASGLAATVERRTTQSDWTTLANISADGSGTFRYEDRSIAAGTRYAYRLSYHSGSEALFTSETWVDVPRPVFALYGLRPNPAINECTVSFSLAENRPAVLEVFDVAGRRVMSQEVGGLGTGVHRLRLDQGVRFAAGVYTLRLIQGSKSLTTRAVVIR